MLLIYISQNKTSLDVLFSSPSFAVSVFLYLSFYSPKSVLENCTGGCNRARERTVLFMLL